MRWFEAGLFFLGIFILMITSSCEREIESGTLKKAFNLEAYVNAQVTFLTQNHYGIRKVTRLDNKKEVVEQYPDSSGWAKELEIVKTVDISKPGIRPLYVVETAEDSLYHLEKFILNDTGQSKTTYQIIYRNKKNDKPAIIRSEQNISNPIYHSKRRIEVVFKKSGPEDKVLIIDSIKVEGYQKIILRDTARYYSITKIRHQ